MWRNINFLLCLLSAIPIIGNSNTIRTDKYLCVHRMDNSIVNYKDTISPRVNIDLEVEKHLKYFEKKLDGFDVEEIFQISVSNSVLLYCCKFKNFTGQFLDVFFMEDSVSKKISKKHFIINSTWMENNEAGFDEQSRLLDTSIFYFRRTSDDGNVKFVIRERVHNGNFYNAVIDHYFQIDLYKIEFIHIVNIESKFISPIDGCLINRVFDGKQIRCYLKCRDKSEEFIGSSEILYGKKFKILSRKIENAMYSKMLITGGFLGEVLFLKTNLLND